MLDRLSKTIRSLQTHLMIASVVLASICLIAYVQITIKRIESELPIRVMKEKRDMERVARDFYEFLATTEAAQARPTAGNVERIKENFNIVDRDLLMLRERYSFDTLIGASALHAVLTPILDDVRIWMKEGFNNVPPTSPIVLELVATRARDALSKVYDKTTEADRIAYEILQQQSTELNRLRTRLIFVLAAIVLLAGGFVWIAIRQQRANRERELAVAETIRAQERLQDALESTSEGFAFFDSDNRLVICNTRYREFFLRGLKDIILPGIDFASIMKIAAERGVVSDSSVSKADAELWLDRRLDQFHNPTGPFAQQLSDGRWIQVNERKTSDGGTVAVYSDITELKHHELELVEAKEDAEAANEAKSSFLANVSHELRTPLTSVVGFARIIQKRLDDLILPNVRSDDTRVARAIRQVRENIDIMLIEGQRLTTLVNNVLDLEKIEAGEMVWNIEPLDLAAVIRQAASATRSLYEHKGLAFSLDVAPNLPPALGDQDKIVQVIINLISNAVKFTARGKIECHATLDGPDRLAIRVSDTGSGISPKDQQVVFEKFRQVGDTLTDKPAGTGLGLPICKEIVEHLGGTIGVDSVVGEGSTFYFTLPVAKVENDTADVAVGLE